MFFDGFLTKTCAFKVFFVLAHKKWGKNKEKESTFAMKLRLIAQTFI